MTHKACCLRHFVSSRLCKIRTLFSPLVLGSSPSCEVLEWAMPAPKSHQKRSPSLPSPCLPSSQSPGKSFSLELGILSAWNKWDRGSGWWQFIWDRTVSRTRGRGSCLQKVVWCPVIGTSGAALISSPFPRQVPQPTVHSENLLMDSSVRYLLFLLLVFD